MQATQPEPPDGQAPESKTASTPVFPDPQRNLYLWECLRRGVDESYRSMSNAECQAECKRLVQLGVLDIQAIQDASENKIPVIVQVLKVAKANKRAQTPSGVQRRTSRLLDLRKGGAIHLSAEEAPIAIFPALSAAGGSLAQLLSEADEPLPVVRVDHSGMKGQTGQLGQAGLPISYPFEFEGGTPTHCVCEACQPAIAK